MKRVISIILICILLLGCTSQNTQYGFKEIESDEVSSIQATPGGSINIPLTNYETLHPLFNRNRSIYQLNKLVYEPLFSYTGEGSIESTLVEHHEVSPDGMIVSITLRDDVYFHDGQKLTTQDVVSTFDAIKNSEVYSPYTEGFKLAVGSGLEFDLDGFMEMSIFDERNLDIHLKEPYRDYLNLLTFPILSSQDQGLEVLENDNTNYFPNGTGPYQVKLIEDEKVTLTINDNYHGRLPYIEQIIGIVYDDAELAKLSFEIGEIDIYDLNSHDWNKYLDDSKINIENYLSNEIDILYLNSRSSVFNGDNGKIIKQAISKSINKKRLIDRVYLGHAQDIYLPLNKTSENMLDLKPAIYYNANEAIEQLESIGYTIDNSTGLMKNTAGETIDVQLKTNLLDPNKRTILNFLIEDLKSIGINAYIQDSTENLSRLTPELKEQYQKTLIEQVNSGAFDIALLSVSLSENPDIGKFIHSSSINEGLNYSYYSRTEVDVILDKIKLSEEEDLQDLYLDLSKYLAEDVPIFPLYIKENAVLVGDKIKGDLDPFNEYIYNKIRDIFILKQDQ